MAIFKLFVLNGKCILIQMSLQFIPRGPIHNKPVLVQIMATEVDSALGQPGRSNMGTQLAQVSTVVTWELNINAYSIRSSGVIGESSIWTWPWSQPMQRTCSYMGTLMAGAGGWGGGWGLNIKMSSYQYMNPHVKIRRSWDRLIFNMGISIPRKDGLYIETGTRCTTCIGNYNRR